MKLKGPNTDPIYHSSYKDQTQTPTHNGIQGTKHKPTDTMGVTRTNHPEMGATRTHTWSYKVQTKTSHIMEATRTKYKPPQTMGATSIRHKPTDTIEATRTKHKHTQWELQGPNINPHTMRATRTEHKHNIQWEL